MYGLAFFSMGLLVALEGGRSSEERVRKALRPLAGFGLVHAAHEWIEMFAQISIGTGQALAPGWIVLRLTTLAFSFLSLAAFGGFLLARDETAQRVSLLIPLGLEAIWVFGLTTLRGQYPPASLYGVVDVWTRYSLALPASILAALGLIAQQRAFRRVGMVRFGQDALWAAVAFAWYGIVGQVFTRASALPPSTFINEGLFLRLFGFPVQLLRATLASAASIYVIRFLHAFQVETEQKIAALQAAQLSESQQRESLRGELFRRIVAAQESERQRIARDLHDETGQALTAIGLGLRGLESRVSNDAPAATQTLHELQTLTAESLRELQRLMSDLRPAHLDDLGLAATLRWYASRLEERTGLRIHVDNAGNERPMADAARICTFRIVQEALNNVIRHAEAARVDVALEYADDSVRVVVRDDGRGFDIERLKQPSASHRQPLGLAGMQERAALLGGHVTIRSRPGEGTLIEASLPYGEESEGLRDDSPAPGG
ncbi:MAG TPA: sensor histidine kinase [Anaerolineales bacterium]|nr:sensor histidine kinase [Anaerolineales bacterium]